MTIAVATTGMTGNTYKALFRKQILRVKPPAVGMAVAYVSASGFSLVKKILDEAGVGEVRLVTDTKDGVTHPKALQDAVDSGWHVRVVDNLAGTFHPKLYVGAAGFDDDAGVADLSLAITGSPNLSHGGFLKTGNASSGARLPTAVNPLPRHGWTAGTPAFKPLPTSWPPTRSISPSGIDTASRKIWSPLELPTAFRKRLTARRRRVLYQRRLFRTHWPISEFRWR